MTSHRTISSGLLAAAAISAAPACASANPLLSGYGGPGQGSQAILGSALVGGGAGGGGGSTGGSAGGGTAGGGAGAPALAHKGEPSSNTGSSTAGAKGAGGARSSARGTGSHASGGAPGAGVSSSAGPGVYPALIAERAYLSSAGGAGEGLSARDFVYGLLALALLALTAALTRRLTRRSERTGGAS